MLRPWGCKESDTTERLNWIEMLSRHEALINTRHYYHFSEKPCKVGHNPILYVKKISQKGLSAQSFQLCPTLSNPVDCSPPGSSVHGILQARKLEWVAMPFSRGSSQPRYQTQVSYIYLSWQVGSLPLVPPGKLVLCKISLVLLVHHFVSILFLP